MPRSCSAWLHSSSKITSEYGVQFDVKYIGCLEVLTPMKTLDFFERSQVAKECINRVCEEANLKTRKKRKIDKKILSYISDKPELINSGVDVTLTISSNLLRLENSETNATIGEYDMPKISFASGGDAEMLDFVAFVAKNDQDWRACFVLECVGGYASEIISTIGQAFDLRFKQHLSTTEAIGGSNFRADTEYYNDLPGKMPPDLLAELADVDQKPKDVPQNFRSRKSSNLIDFNSPPANHDYINDHKSEFTDPTNQQSNDVFEEGGAVGGTFLNSTNDNNSIKTGLDPFSLSTEIQRSQLVTENWYHGCISRAESEKLLQRDGEFLVRESKGNRQFCLSGMQGGIPRHLLLIDPNGVVRTKDHVFESISHLINFHFANSLPIIVSESALLLRFPIDKRLSPAVAPQTPTTPTSPDVFFKTK